MNHYLGMSHNKCHNKKQAGRFVAPCPFLPNYLRRPSSAMRAPSTQTWAKEPDSTRFACKFPISISSYHIAIFSDRSSIASQKVSFASRKTSLPVLARRICASVMSEVSVPWLSR